MKKGFKKSIIASSLFAVSATVGFLSCCKAPQSNSSQNNIDIADVPLTPREILLDSIVNLKGFKATGAINILTEANQEASITISEAKGVIDGLNNIEFDGHLDVKYQGLSISANLNYYDSTVFFNYGENYFKLETDKIFSFVDMLPDYNITIDLPEEVKNLDFTSMESEIANMEYEQAPDGSYLFSLPLSDDLVIRLKSDKEYRFTGAIIDTTYISSMYFSLNIDIERYAIEDLAMQNPLEGENASKYQSFEPAFNLFKSAYNTFGRKNNTLKYSFDLNKDNELEVSEDFISSEGYITYDFDNMKFNLDASLTEDYHARKHNFDISFADKTIYAGYNDFKVRFTTETISNILDYAAYKIGNDVIEDFINDLVNKAPEIDLEKVNEVLNKVGKVEEVLKTINIEDNSLSFTLNASNFGIDAENMVFTTEFGKDDNQIDVIKGISINNIDVKGYHANITIEPSEFIEVNPSEEDYVEIAPALTLIDTFEGLLTREVQDYRIEFGGLVDSNDEEVQDVTIDGGLQFNLNDNFGYGEVTIVDQTSYRHNLKADMRNADQVIFSYNDKLNGKLTVQTMKDIIELGKTIYEEKDEHFMELFGELLESLSNTPIMQIIKGDYGLALACEPISNFNVTDTLISMDINGKIIGYEDKHIHLEVIYDDSHFYSLSISELELFGNTFEFHFDLKDFNKNLESSRLDPFKSYMDFSDIKVLLELGINTSKFNYYHFVGTATLDVHIYDLDLTVDVKVRNDHGKVQVAVNLPNVPTKKILVNINKNENFDGTDSRSVAMYYEDGRFYFHREDVVYNKSGFFGTKKTYYTYSVNEVCDGGYLLDNILNIALKDMLGLSDFLMGLIEDKVNESHSSTDPIKYEEILKDFQYNKSQHYFLFNINLATIVHNDQLTGFTVKVRTTNDDTSLKGLDVNLTALSIIDIKLNIDLVEGSKDIESEEHHISDLESYVALHKDDTINTKSTSQVAR